MEYADAGSLGKMIKKRSEQGHLYTVAELLDYISQVCKAVLYV